MCNTSPNETFFEPLFGVRFPLSTNLFINHHSNPVSLALDYVGSFSHGLNGHSEVSKKFGSFNQQLSRSALAPRSSVRRVVFRLNVKPLVYCCELQNFRNLLFRGFNNWNTVGRHEGLFYSQRQHLLDVISEACGK